MGPNEEAFVLPLASLGPRMVSSEDPTPQLALVRGTGSSLRSAAAPRAPAPV